MTRTEIQEFKRFLHVRNIYMMFSQIYRQNHLSVNPPTLEAYRLAPEKEYFQLGIELLAETKDYLLFMLRK